MLDMVVVGAHKFIAIGDFLHRTSWILQFPHCMLRPQNTSRESTQEDQESVNCLNEQKAREEIIVKEKERVIAIIVKELPPLRDICEGLKMRSSVAQINRIIADIAIEPPELIGVYLQKLAHRIHDDLKGQSFWH